MAITLTAQLAGAVNLYDNTGAGYGGKPFTFGTPQNANAPPPSGASLQAGINTILVPAGATIYAAVIRSDPNSANIKTFKGVSGDVGFTQAFGSAPAILPVVPGGSFVIVSPGAELVEIVYV